MKTKFVIISWLFSLAIFAQNIEFSKLICESRINPLGIDNQKPRFTWQINADGFNRSQTAYQVLVATSKDKLRSRKADCWNSGKVNSAQSNLIRYGGTTLLPTTKYYWCTKVWDENGKPSKWSSVQSFETGLLSDDQWGDAQFMTLTHDNRQSEHRFREYKTSSMDDPVMLTSQAAGYFRKTINVRKEVASARAYVVGLGYYELYVNGQKKGDHVLDPAPSNYDKQAYYVVYDLTKQLKTGDNALGLILGNGFYGQSISWKNDPASEPELFFGQPAIQLRVKVCYTDGTSENFYSNDQWRANTGPIVFDNVYGGEIYDARYEFPAWSTTDYNDESWHKVKIISPKLKKISAQKIPPIRKLKELTAKRIFKGSNGNWIVDFGQNIAGWIQITVTGERGQAIKLITTETLTQDGKDIYPGSTGGGANGMAQWLKYICKGEGEEVWEPRFTYHGFRYAEVIGMTPTKNNIKAVLVATDVEETGSFVCSDPLLNKMDTISRWTIASNLHGIPEDCPQREKCGWLGDAHAFAEYALYTYDLHAFYVKYMEDIRTQMRPTKGGEQSTEKYMVPTMVAPGKRTSTYAKLDWGVATMYLPWYVYVYYGDTAVVLEYYKEMKNLTEFYLTFKDKDGILRDGLGDWCPPRWDRKRYPQAMECHPEVSANAYFYEVLGIMQRFAHMANDTAYAQVMHEERTKLKSSFNKVYLETIPLVNHKWYGSQTATVMALQFDMVPDEEKQSVLDGLAYDIIAVKGGHHASGIHGLRYLYTVLANNSNIDLAYEILTTPTFPSQTYIMNCGFTTWPERQFYWDDMDELTNSLNHPMHTGFAAFFYETLGGIKTSHSAVAHKEFTVHPIFSKGISSTAVNIATPYGYISNAWTCKAGIFTMQLQVPFNTKAKVFITDEQLKDLMINDSSFAALKNKYDIHWSDGFLTIGSGSYTIQYTM